jgi:hypothetical protein
MSNFLVLIIVAVVAVVLLAIRTNAALVLFALTGGAVILQFANKNIAYVNGHIEKSLVPSQFAISTPSIELAILLVPPIIAAALIKHNQGPAKWPLQVAPAIATGILGVLLVTPLLSSSLQHSITQGKFWSLSQQYQIPVVAICVLSALVVVILSSYSGHGSSKHHHK